MPNITGHTELVGLMAYPIRHTQSPTTHNLAYDKNGDDVIQLAFEVDNDSLKDAVQSIRALKMLGSNISMPNKTVVHKYLDEVDEAAKLCGAINTVVNLRDENGQVTGKLKGYNTDGMGYWQALTEEGIEGGTIKYSFDIWNMAVKWCRELGIKIMIDIHSAETASAGHQVSLWYTDKFSTEDWCDALAWFADYYKDDDTILAIDLKNEPHGTADVKDQMAKWDDSTDPTNWKYAAETCAARVLEKNPELLIMVEGTEVYPKEGYDWTAPRIDYTTMTEYYYGTWWGGNFRGAKKYPIDLGKYQSQLVYSPHDYGPLVWEQKWFYDGFTQETLLKDCWYDNWFFLQDEGVAPLLMGEWGGFMDGDKNEQWMTYLRDFMIENRIHHTFWCFNENSGDTGGLVYDNFGKWDEDKYALVKPALWQDDNGKFISLDHTIALGSNGISLSDYYGGGNNNTTEPDSKIIAGDVNSDKLVNGVDLTLMRQNITKWQSTDDVLTASPQDTNGNGVFSIADIVLLTQYLLGKDVILKSYSS